MANLEKLFERLKRRDGSKFGDDTVRNWYRARRYVLARMADMDCNGKCSAPHVVVEGMSPLMCSVVRHLVLVAHYPGFDEVKGSPRTRITILCRGMHTVEELEAAAAGLSAEEYLCNYALMAPRLFRKTPNEEPQQRDAVLPWLDVELEFVGVDKYSDYTEKCELRATDADADATVAAIPDDDLYIIDTSKAVLANMVYWVGADLENLPATDTTATKRYDLALNTLCYKKQRSKTNNAWKNAGDVKGKLSNVFLADTFEARLRGLLAKECKDRADKLKKEPRFYRPALRDLWRYRERKMDLIAYASRHKRSLMRLVAGELKALSRCEHSRWVAEKLVMGFRPLSAAEAYRLEGLFGADRAAFIKSLKKNVADPAHIDLCSYAELRRISPADMKYDCLLVLAMPHLLVESLTVKQIETNEDEK